MSKDRDQVPVLILVSGYAGAGKSTLAELLAIELNATVASFDWVMSALRNDPDVWPHIEAPKERVRQIGWTSLARIAEQQLRIGKSCVLDTVAHESCRRELAALAARYEARFSVIECVCTDPSLHRSRVEGRRRGIPGWYELDASDVERSRAKYVPLRQPTVVIDGATDLKANLEAALQHVAAASDPADGFA